MLINSVPLNCVNQAAIRYNVPKGSAVGYMPELNVLCPIGDFSAQSNQPLMKHLIVEVTPAEGWQLLSESVRGEPLPNPVNLGQIGPGSAGVLVVRLRRRSGTAQPAVTVEFLNDRERRSADRPSSADACYELSHP